jgi:hypothetical protein
MASPNFENEAAGPPTKRQKISAETPSIVNTTQPVTTTQPGKDVKMDDRKTHLAVVDNGFQPEREAEVGILHFVNTSNPGFSGTLKQRYVSGCCSLSPFVFEAWALQSMGFHAASLYSKCGSHNGRVLFLALGSCVKVTQVLR